MQTRQENAPSGRVGIGIMTILHALLWASILLYLTLYAPRLEKLFRDFNMRVPADTEWMLACSRWARTYLYLLPIVLLLLVSVDVQVALLLRRRVGSVLLSWLWLSLVTVATVILAGFFVVGSLTPLVKLHEGLSK